MKKVLMMAFLTLTILFGFFFNMESKVFATEHADVITRAYLADEKGNELKSPNIDQWQQFRLTVDFNLHNNKVMTGDTTVVKLPDVLYLPVTSNFDIKDQDGHLVAKAVVNRETKTATITYEPYVETHSDVKGTFYFYVRVNHDLVKTAKEIQIDITVSGKIYPAGKVNFKGIGQSIKDNLNKVGWQDATEPTIGRYSISVNRSGKPMTGIKVVDVLKIPNASYKQETFKVYKGNWVFRNGDWFLDNSVDITAQTPITFNADNFSVQLPDLSANEGIWISYAVQLPYVPVEGEQFSNDATLTTINGIEETYKSVYIIYSGNGKAEGYTFKVQIKKVSEDGSALKGAQFDVIRDRSGQVVAKIETNEQGIAEVGNLLKDTYTLKETKAPAGYDLAEDVKVKPEDFDTTYRLATKTIVDKKTVPAQAQLTAKKLLDGRNLKDGEFSFSLSDANGTVIETIKNKANGNIDFTALNFNKAGIYNYTIREVKGDEKNITYDPSEIKATITVVENNGKLVTSVSYEGGKNTFKNTYTPPSTPPPGGKEELPKTGTNDNGILVFVGLISLVIAKFLLFQKRD